MLLRLQLPWVRRLPQASVLSLQAPGQQRQTALVSVIAGLLSKCLHIASFHAKLAVMTDTGLTGLEG